MFQKNVMPLCPQYSVMLWSLLQFYAVLGTVFHTVDEIDLYIHSQSQLARMCGAGNRMERAIGLPPYGDWQRFMGGINMDPLAQDDLRFLCVFSACVFLNLLTLCLVILHCCFHFFKSKYVIV